MRVALCLDDNNGMTFNSRRQSRDRVLICDLLCDISNGERLFAAPYSKILFYTNDTRLVICDDSLASAADDDLCFVENMQVTPYLSKIGVFIIYRWNRHYPADFYFDFDMKGFKMVSVTEFAGSSHQKITKEIWRAL